MKIEVRKTTLDEAVSGLLADDDFVGRCGGLGALQTLDEAAYRELVRAWRTERELVELVAQGKMPPAEAIRALWLEFRLRPPAALMDALCDEQDQRRSPTRRADQTRDEVVARCVELAKTGVYPSNAKIFQRVARETGLSADLIRKDVERAEGAKGFKLALIREAAFARRDAYDPL